MRGGEYKAYAMDGQHIAATNTQGKGRDEGGVSGKADPSNTIYREIINEPNWKKLSAFAGRAATVIGVEKSRIIIEDIRGIKYPAMSLMAEGSDPTAIYS